MILYKNLQEICARSKASERVLDVGGWHNPFNLATHVIDLGQHATRRTHECLDPENAERFSADTWAIQDICDGTWPYQDNEFDFVFCSHTLEDLRDPIHVSRELSRVAKSGYVEVPSRMREIFCKKRFPALSFLRGTAPEIGFRHHRWYCEPMDGGIAFTAKTAQVCESRDYYITRFEAGRKLTEEESGLCVWWDDGFEAEEVIAADVDENLRAFKRTAMAAIRGR